MGMISWESVEEESNRRRIVLRSKMWACACGEVNGFRGFGIVCAGVSWVWEACEYFGMNRVIRVLSSSANVNRRRKICVSYLFR